MLWVILPSGLAWYSGTHLCMPCSPAEEPCFASWHEFLTYKDCNATQIVKRGGLHEMGQLLLLIAKERGDEAMAAAAAASHAAGIPNGTGAAALNAATAAPAVAPGSDVSAAAPLDPMAPSLLPTPTSEEPCSEHMPVAIEPAPLTAPAVPVSASIPMPLAGMSLTAGLPPSANAASGQPSPALPQRLASMPSGTTSPSLSNGDSL